MLLPSLQELDPIQGPAQAGAPGWAKDPDSSSVLSARGNLSHPCLNKELVNNVANITKDLILSCLQPCGFVTNRCCGTTRK